MLAVIYVLNILGIEAVGIASVVFTCFSVTPFLLLLVTHLLKTGFYMNWPALATVPRNIKWATFFTTASWNLSGIEQAGTVAEDVKDPQRTFTNSLLPLVGLAIMTYLPPVLVGASATTGAINLDEWQTGFWAEVSYRVGGGALKAVIVLGSVVSAFGLTLSALCTTSHIIAGMALTEAFPGWVGELLCRRHYRFGTYHWAITANTVLTAVFSMLFDFQSLVMIGQFLYSIRMLCVFMSFLLIRQHFPYLERPYRMPITGAKMYALLGMAMLLYVALMCISISQEWSSAVISLTILAASGAFSWYYCTYVRTKDFLGRIVTASVEEDVELTECDREEEDSHL
ncbi:amino acid permease/transporter [Strigomonas culicis]|nr:amino acid permease/transporter [Strigomonas culicis]|eukprot:EPY20132.1 amino acid permease/transporter [Strigomonas culicis]